MASDPGLLYYCYHCERTVHLASPDTLICADCHGDFIEERPDVSSAPEDMPSPSEFAFNEIDYMGPGFGQLLEDMSSFLAHMQVTAQGLDPSHDDPPQILRLGTDARALNPILLLQGRILNSRVGQYVVDNGEPLRLPGTIGDYFVGPGLEHLIQQLAEDDPNKYGSPPASKSAIEALPSLSMSEEHLASSAAQCAVCKEEFELESQVKPLPCNHMYHPDCILPWLEQHNSCPVCRYELPTDDPDYEQSRTQGPGGGHDSGTTRADGSHDEERTGDSFAFQNLPGQPVVARYPTEIDNASDQQDVLLGLQAAEITEGGINGGSNGGAAIVGHSSLLTTWLRGVPAMSQSRAITQAENLSSGNFTVSSEARNDRNSLREQRIRELLASADNDGDTHMSETREEELD